MPDNVASVGQSLWRRTMGHRFDGLNGLTRIYLYRVCFLRSQKKSVLIRSIGQIRVSSKKIALAIRIRRNIPIPILIHPLIMPRHLKLQTNRLIHRHFRKLHIQNNFPRLRTLKFEITIMRKQTSAIHFPVIAILD